MLLIKKVVVQVLLPWVGQTQISQQFCCEQDMVIVIEIFLKFIKANQFIYALLV